MGCLKHDACFSGLDDQDDRSSLLFRLKDEDLLRWGQTNTLSQRVAREKHNILNEYVRLERTSLQPHVCFMDFFFAGAVRA